MRTFIFFIITFLFGLSVSYGTSPGVKRSRSTVQGTPGAQGATGAAGADGAAGTANNSTFTKTMEVNGDLFLATATIRPVSGAGFAVRQATLTTVGIWTHLVNPTSAYMWCKLVKSTSTDAGHPWVDYSPLIENTTDQQYSIYYTTVMVLYANTSYSVHVTSVPENGWRPPADLQFNIDMWANNP